MSEQIISTPTAPDKNVRPARMPLVAIWLSIVALVLCALLVVPYMALQSPVVPLFFALMAGTGIAGIVLGVRARRAVSARGGWAMICALTSLLIAVVMTIIFIVGMIAVTSINRVELRGQGPEGMSASMSHDAGDRTETWPAEGWARFNTKQSWAELILEAPEDAESDTVSCQIIWNGEVVVDETSDSGSVTCRYDAR